MTILANLVDICVMFFRNCKFAEESGFYNRDKKSQDNILSNRIFPYVVGMRFSDSALFLARFSSLQSAKTIPSPERQDSTARIASALWIVAGNAHCVSTVNVRNTVNCTPNIKSASLSLSHDFASISFTSFSAYDMPYFGMIML